jgi:hypothetical protein
VTRHALHYCIMQSMQKVVLMCPSWSCHMMHLLLAIGEVCWYRYDCICHQFVWAEVLLCRLAQLFQNKSADLFWCIKHLLPSLLHYMEAASNWAGCHTYMQTPC